MYFNLSIGGITLVLALYPGSFDPVTNGHLDVLKRALKIFENERLTKIIKKVAEEHQISESVIKNILTNEITSLIKYKK